MVVDPNQRYGSNLKFPREQDVFEYGGILEFSVFKTFPPKVTEMNGLGSMLRGFGIDIKSGIVENITGTPPTSLPTNLRFGRLGGRSIPGGMSGADLEAIEKKLGLETKLNDVKNASEAFVSADQFGPSRAPNQERTVRLKEAGTVQLYMPQSIQLTDGLDYDRNVQFGIFGSLIERGIASGDNVMSSVFRGIGEAFSTLKDAAFGGASEEVVSLAVARLSELPGIDGSGAGPAIRSALQKTANPNIRAVFKQVNLRELSLMFKMKPTSEREANEIKDIITFFRTNAYPESVRLKGISAGYKFPRKFKVKFLYKNPVTGEVKNVGYKMKLLHLAGVTTTFNPNNMAFYTDGNFEEIDLELRFVEEQTLDQQDVKAGF